MLKRSLFWSLNEVNLHICNILILGNKNTPYENGIFLFKCIFPENYPYKPPKIEFITRYKNIRFHQNLYLNGKICLSILNTWYGQKWSPCNSLETLLIILKSLFTEYHIEHEPGYQNKINSQMSTNYNILLK